MGDKNFTERLYDRIFANPIYFIFGLSWFLVHWRFFVVMFLVSNESIISSYGVTKDVYLKHILFDTSSWGISLLVVSIPFFATWIILYVIQPKLLPTLLQKHKEYEDERLNIERGFIVEETAIQRERQKLLDFMELNTEKEKKIKETDPTVKWEEDFLKFKKTPNIYGFRSFVTHFYSGDRTVDNPNLAAYMDSMGLVDLAETNPNFVENFTEKGKFFVKRINESETENPAR